MTEQTNSGELRIAVLHDWRPTPRPNLFGEDMWTDQIHRDVALILADLLNASPGVEAQAVLVDDLEVAVSGGGEFPWNGAVNLAYGEYGRFHLASMPVLLDRVGVPNFGADPFLMLLARNKQHTKNVAAQIGLRIAPSAFYDEATQHFIADMPSDLLPCIVKPNEAASGLGLKAEIYEDRSHAIGRTLELIEAYPEGVMVERFIAGEEVTTAALSDGPDVKTFAYVLKEPGGGDLPLTYLNAYRENLDAYEQGLRLWKDLGALGYHNVELRAKQNTERLVRELGINGYTRSDFRLSPEGVLYFLELNGQAGIGLGPSVVTTIGIDHYGDRLGFIRALAETATRYLRRVRSSASKGHKRWAYQFGP